MAMAFPDVDGVGVDISSDHEYGILVAADVEAFTLADGVELRPVVLANNFAPWVVLVAGLLDVFLAAAIDFRLELYRRIINGFRQLYPIFVAQGGEFCRGEDVFQDVTGPSTPLRDRDEVLRDREEVLWNWSARAAAMMARWAKLFEAGIWSGWPEERPPRIDSSPQVDSSLHIDSSLRSE